MPSTPTDRTATRACNNADIEYVDMTWTAKDL
eukprot:CAMPEP_0204255074 /NCGR_PEP_ID=MMETSP0468-20130131/2984_1 /ASSEMBLY_ACC=CAM_ASM_000383 /TAXON_ID=2969 /ORGANISM="Oxyrrhis marina" /LENGTH=31 /DNA_ID= /DNA_START= /DNA_END= /DNA_ORIENTATION=